MKGGAARTRVAARRSHLKTSWAATLAAGLTACSIGEGGGEVQSDRLTIENCWDGPFDLDPTFFAANPFRDTMMIRVQRGEEQIEVSDGLLMIVNDVSELREEQLGSQIELGLPVGVSPPGLPEQLVLDPPQVSMSLYLFETCHRQNPALHSVGGWIRFDSLFSGNPNETKADDRLTEATFEAVMADPREVELVEASADGGAPAVTFPEGTTSTVSGEFRFFFQRGVPAQPFP